MDVNLFKEKLKFTIFVEVTAMQGTLKMSNLASVKTSTNVKVEMLLVIRVVKFVIIL